MALMKLSCAKMNVEDMRRNSFARSWGGKSVVKMSTIRRTRRSAAKLIEAERLSYEPTKLEQALEKAREAKLEILRMELQHARDRLDRAAENLYTFEALDGWDELGERELEQPFDFYDDDDGYVFEPRLIL